ncbi:MAG: bifunctional 3,4-dihydroxy-2-butanone-4-phosphate synthase/GTP cyclohydrolase II [Dehalococcoidia bacterium]|nr:bifunctional 3,4-dihydroxy-2-butanone-4-phosphate synthase/GTP cyclohydrolase II [Dehalococcoidia bacterium]
MPLSTIEQGLEDLKQGKLIIIVDDEDRENEGDLAVLADKVTPEHISFMAKHGRGLICMPVMGKRLDELLIPLMVQDNTARNNTAFTVSVEAKQNTTTGISAYDRAATVKEIIDPKTRPEDLLRPGHLFPIRAREGGVLVRAGQTEAMVDMARLSGMYPAGVICEIMKDDGTMARMPDLEIMAKEFGLKIVSVADLIAYRRRHEKLVERVTQAKLPTDYGDFTAIVYRSATDPEPHVALVKGDISGNEPVLVRVHSECLTGDVLHSLRCDCGEQLAQAMAAIAKEGRGILLYMRQEGRGMGLASKIMAYALQDKGMDTVEANVALGFAPDLREYGIGAQILVDLGVRNMKLLTNNPKKVVGIEAHGLKVVEQVPIQVVANVYNKRYLQTKRDKMGHLIEGN